MEQNWEKLGLKAGLECHQQLDTGKLFCRCPSILREDKPDYTFERKLRAVASELGEFDKAALEAFKKDQTFEYQGYKDTNCLIEADEEPPKPADKQALETILKAALMTKSQILDQMFVMRKAVVDGSNTSAFQRTMLTATGGEIEITNKKVGILSIALEEDAARPIERTPEKVTYRLDRLGIPLIELATAPDLKTPEEVKECAQKIGELFRRTCKAKRGLGTIRQDVNISIARGARVEIKGVQDLGMIDEHVRKEVKRQQALIETMEEMKNRGLVEKDFEKNELIELTNMFTETECKFLKGKKVFGFKLENMLGLLGKEVQPGRRFGTELAGYVKAKAGLKGILHSDELPSYGITEKEVQEARQKCACGEKDAFVIVQAEQEKALKAIEAILERCKQALIGVPEETRNALEDGNTEYSRPLPGAARMYPETDLAPVTIEEKELTKLKKELPLTVEQREKLYASKGLSGKLVEGMKLSNHACFFEAMLKKGINATTAATLLLDGITQLRREGVKNITNEMVEETLALEKSKKISKDILLDFLKERKKRPGEKAEDILKAMNIEKAGEGEIRKAIQEIVQKNQGLVEAKGIGAIGALMGDAMKQLKGKASGQEISKILKEEIEKTSE